MILETDRIVAARYAQIIMLSQPILSRIEMLDKLSYAQEMPPREKHHCLNCYNL